MGDTGEGLIEKEAYRSMPGMPTCRSGSEGVRADCNLKSAARGGPPQGGEGAVRGSADTSMGDGGPGGRGGQARCLQGQRGGCEPGWRDSRWGGLSEGGRTWAAGSEVGGGKWGGGCGGAVPSLPASDAAAASGPAPARPSCSALSTAQLPTPRLPPTPTT